jgi:hypothetical protein
VREDTLVIRENFLPLVYPVVQAFKEEEIERERARERGRDREKEREREREREKENFCFTGAYAMVRAIEIMCS